VIDLIVVNPNYRNSSPFGAVEPAFRCGLLASYILVKGLSVEIVDAEAENLTASETAERIKGRARLIAVVVQGANPSAQATPKMVAAGALLDKLDSRENTILIGMHPSALPQHTLLSENVDFVCVGEGFTSVEQLLNEVKTRDIPGIFPNEPAELIEKLPDIPFELLPMDLYQAHNWHSMGRKNKPYGVSYTSLGCPYNCSYCNIKHTSNGKPNIRFRDMLSTAEEIDWLYFKYGITNIKIMDELFAINDKRVDEFYKLMKDREYASELNIFTNGRVDTVNPEMLKKMYASGVRWICYGFESVDAHVLGKAGKTYSQQLVEEVIDATREAGINIIANFIFGLPDDTYESMQATLDMAKRHNFEYFNLYVAMTYPGTELYDEAIKQGIEMSTNWEDYGQYSPNTMGLPTKYLTAKQIRDFRDKSFIEYYDRPEYKEMIAEKFGDKAAEDIERMLEWNPRS